MSDEEASKVEKKIETTKTRETSFFKSINPTAIILIGIAIILSLLYGKFTRNQWITIIAGILIIFFLLREKIPIGGFLFTEEAWEVAEIKLKKFVDKSYWTGKVKIYRGLASALPQIDGEYREYFLPFVIQNISTNITEEIVARVNAYTGNTTIYYTPEGFFGTEKPAIRKVLPDDFMTLRKVGLDKLLFGRSRF